MEAKVSGYEPGDPVRVELPSSLTERRVMLEGVVVEVLRDGFYRVRLTDRREHEGVIIEQIAAKRDRFT